MQDRESVINNLVTVREINHVLKRLMQHHGIFTYHRKVDIPCCQSCGCYGVPTEYGSKYVFYNVQSVDDRSVIDGRVYQTVGLSWGEDVDFETVRQVFAEHGIKVTGGDLSKKLEIHPEKIQ
jgi:hypothetical protein